VTGRSRSVGIGGLVAVAAVLAFVATGSVPVLETSPVDTAAESPDPGPAEVWGTSRQMQQADLLEACMLEHGIPTIRQGIAVGFKVPREQQESYEAALRVCSATVDEALPEPPVLTGRDYYEALVDAAECLRRLGYSIGDPPSLDSFLESLSSNRPPWSPYLDLPDSMSQQAWNEALAACPQPVGR